MPDTTSNLLITTNDNTAVVGTDYGTSGTGVSLAHVPLQKAVWGSEGQAYRVSETYPMPVQVFGVSGGALGVTFGGITGSVTVVNRANTFLVIGGASGTLPANYAPVPVSGHVQGTTNGILLGITGSVNVSNTVFVQGMTTGIALGITGGRQLNKNVDSITVYGSVGLSGGLALTAGSNSVSVFGYDGGQKVLTKLYASDGTTLGTSGNALNVNVVGASINATVNVSSVVGVTNASEGALKVRGSGITSDHPVLIKGTVGTAGELAVTTLSQLTVGVSGDVSINDTDIINSLESTTKPLISNLAVIKNNTGVISTINDKLSAGTISTKISEIIKPSKLYNGSKVASTTSSVITTASTVLKVGVHLKCPITNTSDVYIGSSTMSNTTNGFPLGPGESIFLEIDNLNKIYLLAATTTESQKVHYIAS